MSNANGLRNLLLKEAERWGRPASSTETVLVTAIEGLPSHEIARAPNAMLFQHGMLPRECHANIERWVTNDPEAESKLVLGWWITGAGLYTLHSVVKIGDTMACLTPSDIHGDMDTIEFIPDPELEVVRKDGVRRFLRQGVEVPATLRRDPQQVIQIMADAREQLEQGRSPKLVLEVIAARMNETGA